MFKNDIKHFSMLILIVFIAFYLTACGGGSNDNLGIEDVSSSYYNLSIAVEGGGTTDPPPGEYDAEKSSNFTVSAAANDGWSFTNWKGDVPSNIENDKEIDLLMTEDKNITAVFGGDLRVNFTVVDENNEPLEGALIILSDFYKVTDEMGEVTFAVGSGKYEFSVSKRNYISEDGAEMFKGEIEVERDLVEVEEIKLKEFIIQEAIDNAQSGAEIIVPPGTYFENIIFDGKNIKLISSNPSEPRQTVIDGQAADRVVQFINGEGEAAHLEGFTVRNGNGEYGGGILIGDHSSPTIVGNIITDNKCEHNGAGITIAVSSSPLIKNNIIRNNESQYIGGGIAIGENSSPQIEDNLIENNYSEMSGGGVVIVDNSNPQFIRNEIIYNEASYMGGGIAIAQESSPIIKNNKIENNQSNNSGAGILVTGNSRPVIEDNEIGANWSFYVGGGIAVGGGSNPKIYSNSIINNIAFGLGGGIFVSLDSEILNEGDNYWQRRNSPPENESNNLYESNEHGGAIDNGVDVYFNSEESETEVTSLFKNHQNKNTIIPQDIEDFDYKSFN